MTTIERKTAPGQRPAPDLPGGYVALEASEIPPDARHFLSLVLSPSFEVGILATQTAEQEEEPQQAEPQQDNAVNEQQYISADAALVVTDILLSLWPLLLPHVSQETMDSEAGRVMRLRNAYQASDLTRRRQQRHAHIAKQEAEAAQPVTCDGEPPVTTSARRPGRDNPLRPTAAEIQATASRHTCTCIFAGGEIAVVNVYGAPSQEHANFAVSWLWFPKCYRVEDGDLSNGHARPFTLIQSTAYAKPNATLLRFEGQGQIQAGEEAQEV